MNILVDGHVFDGEFQGTRTYIKGLYEAFHKMYSDKVQVYIAAENIENLKSSFPDLPNERFLKLNGGGKIQRFLKDIPSLVKEHNIDYVHFQYVVSPFKPKGVKYINTIHDLLFLDQKQHFSLKYRLTKGVLFYLSYRFSEVLLTVSEYSKQSIKEKFNVKRDVFVTPNGVQVEPGDEKDMDDSFIKSSGIDGKFWLYVSRFEPRKNHCGLLKVFIKNKHYLDYTLVLVGDETIKCHDFDNYYTTLTEEQKSKVVILRNIESKELALLFSKASLFVYPSKAEGFGIPPLEAGVYKVPTVCSNQTAMEDFSFFKRGHFNPENIEDFNSKILDSLNTTEEELEEIKNTIQSTYNWERSAKVLAKALNI